MQQDIELHIDTLVIEGYSHLDALRLKEAIERELQQIIQEKGFSHMETELIGLPNMKLSITTLPSISMNTMGAQVAQTVHQGIHSALSLPAELQTHTTA